MGTGGCGVGTGVGVARGVEGYAADGKCALECSLDLKPDEYQEPYQPLKCAPYFSYSAVLLEMKEFAHDSTAALSGSVFLFINARGYGKTTR